MKFFNPPPRKRAELERHLRSDDPAVVADSLVAMAFHEDDWRWAQDVCLDFLENGNPDLSGLAATCLGHLARIHGRLDMEKVGPALTGRLNHPEIGGRVEDALNDIDMFLARPS